MSFHDSREQLHRAVQIASFVGRNELPPQSDDSHTSFTWSVAEEAFVQPGAGSGLRPRDLTLLLRGKELPLLGRTSAEAYQFLGYQEGDGQVFEADRNDLASLATMYGTAAKLLEEVRARSKDAGPVRCWPHHFDIATLLDHGHGRTTGAGFLAGDTQIDEPYWYVTPWPYPPPFSLPPLKYGSWNADGWVGAVLRDVDEGRARKFLRDVFEKLNSP